MSWKEQLRKSDEIEKNFMQTLSNVADKVIPNREHNRNVKSYHNAVQEVDRKRGGEEYGLLEQRYKEWLSSNPTTFPNGKSTVSEGVDLVRRDGGKQAHNLKMLWMGFGGGQTQVANELKQKYPDPKREDFMKQEEPEPQFVDPENQEDEDEKEEMA